MPSLNPPDVINPISRTWPKVRKKSTTFLHASLPSNVVRLSNASELTTSNSHLHQYPNQKSNCTLPPPQTFPPKSSTVKLGWSMVYSNSDGRKAARLSSWGNNRPATLNRPAGPRSTSRKSSFQVTSHAGRILILILLMPRARRKIPLRFQLTSRSRQPHRHNHNLHATPSFSNIHNLSLHFSLFQVLLALLCSLHRSFGPPSLLISQLTDVDILFDGMQIALVLLPISSTPTSLRYKTLPFRGSSIHPGYPSPTGRTSDATPAPVPIVSSHPATPLRSHSAGPRSWP